MTRTEHLLTIAGEECAEVAQRTSKAARFGLKEIQPGQPLDNAERIVQEFTDLVAVLSMLGIVEVDDCNVYVNPVAIWDKRVKVEKYLELSREQGTLS